MTSDSALSAMRDAVLCWQVDDGSPVAIVEAACALLVAGVDGPALRMLAAVPVRGLREDSYEVAELLEPVMLELGLPYRPRESVGGQEWALKEMASLALSGAVSPHDLACWAFRVFGHSGIDLAQTLVGLDDEYDRLEHLDMPTEHKDRTAEDIDRRILVEARRLTALP